MTTTAAWPGLAGLPALAGRAGFGRKSIQLPFASGATPIETDAPEILWGTGNPNHLVVGSVGDVYVQLDGKRVLWEKRTGSATDTGWTRGELGWFDITNHGAVGDDTTDSLAAITEALTEAAATGADGVEGIVVGPPGVAMYRLSNKLTIPGKVRFVGLGRGSLALKALAGFPADTPMVQLGVTGALAFGTRLENLFLFGNGVADIGVYSDSIQEQSGALFCGISGFKKKCLHIASKTAQAAKAQNYIVRDCELSLHTSAGAAAIACHLEADNNAGKTDIDNITVNTSDGVTNVPSTGYQFEGLQGTVENLHMEHVATGCAIGVVTPCIGLTVIGVGGGVGVTDLVVIGNTQNDETTLFGLVSSGATNVVKDNFTGITLTDPRLGKYAIGLANNGGVPNYPDLDPTTSSPAALAAGNTNDYALSSARVGIVRLTGDGGGTSVLTGIAGGLQKRELWLYNVSANNIGIAHADAASLTQNRINIPTGATVTLGQNDVMQLKYDGQTARWRAVNWQI